jgi:hypothetical protein
VLTVISVSLVAIVEKALQLTQQQKASKICRQCDRVVSATQYTSIHHTGVAEHATLLLLL